MPLQFTQEEVENAVAKHLHHGDRVEIARNSGLSESWVKRQLNPDDPEQSSYFRTLLIQCALDEVSPERGEQVWQEICQMRELSKKRVKSTNVCVNAELTKTNSEFDDIWKARLNGKSGYEQLGEICEAETQLSKLKDAVIAEINEEKESFDSPRTRIKAVK